jgi:hypothetical protein
MSKGASLAPQLIKIDLAVLPSAACQGLFNHTAGAKTLKSLSGLHKSADRLSVAVLDWIIFVMTIICP